MNTGKVVIGIILCIIAAWVFALMPTTDPTARYGGGVILLILGIVLIATGRKEKKK